jgi:putative GTP pyrophosphokinase
MRDDFDKIKSDFQSISTTLLMIAEKIEENLAMIFKETHHVDRIACRVKGEESFLNKTLKEEKGILKYSQPFKEIQDMIGARIVIYYKSDLENTQKLVKDYFHSVEATRYIPDDVTKFGYEGFHYVSFIPSAIYSTHKANPLIPDFFELQIKTLYQHAWSQANHGLGYKPGSSLTYEEERKLAFLAAQSWGADQILHELTSSKVH